MGKTLFLLACLLFSSFIFAQTTYTWNVLGGGDWQVASNWTPNRAAPATNDILVFDNGASLGSITNVPTQTIGQLLVSNNTSVFLTGATGVNPTLTISGGTGTDLSIGSGCLFQLNGQTASNQTTTILLATGANAIIQGIMSFNQASHRFDIVDPGAAIFQNGSSCRQLTNCFGSLFTNVGAANVAIFEAGSTFIQNEGNAPFALAAPNSKVVFQTGSLYKLQYNLSIALAGRTFADVEINNPGINATSTGNGTVNIDNLTITDGTWNINLSGASAVVNIKGNISVAAGEVLTFSPLVSSTINFNGSTSSQTINNLGTLTFGANAAVVIANTAPTPSVTFNQAQTIAGSMTVNAGSILATSATLTLSGTPAINGSFQINEGGFATGGTWNYGAAGTLIFNNSTGPYSVNGSPDYWPSANGPINVTVQNTGGISMSVPRTVSGLFQTAAGVSGGNNLTMNGTCQINSGGYFTAGSPIYGASSLLRYNTGGLYSRVAEWDFAGAGTIGTSPGYPNDVQVSNFTTLDLPNTSNLDRACARDLIIDNGSQLYADYNLFSARIFVGRNFTMNGNVSLGSAFGGDMHVKGNFTRNAGTFNPNNRAVFFNGPSGNQTITGTTAFDYLIIDKAAGNVVLNSPVTCNQVLTLTSGKVVTSATNLLTLTDNASWAGASVASNVEGPMKKIGDEDFIFPVGLGGIYAPLGLTGGTGAATTDEFTVEYLRTNPQSLYGNVYTGGINHVSYVEHWTVERNAISTASKRVSLDVHATSFCLQPSTTFVSKHNGSAWTNEPSTGTGFAACGAYQCGTVTTNNPIASFSPFTLATTDPFAVNPLPIKLTRFDAVKISSSRAMISWETAELCSSKALFQLEESADGSNYTLLTTMAGNETSKLYNYADNHLTAGVNYYRLKATDVDGKITYSPVATILNADGGGLTVSLSPNPVSSQAMLSVSVAKSATLQFSIINSSGVMMKQWQQWVAAGTQAVATDLQLLPAGVYQLLCQVETERVVVRFVKH